MSFEIMDRVFNENTYKLNEAMLYSFNQVVSYGIPKIVETGKYSFLRYEDMYFAFVKLNSFLDKPCLKEKSNGIVHSLSVTEAIQRNLNYESSNYISFAIIIFSKINPSQPEKYQSLVQQKQEIIGIDSKAKRLRLDYYSLLSKSLLHSTNTTIATTKDDTTCSSPTSLVSLEHNTVYQEKLKYCQNLARLTEFERTSYPYLVSYTVYPKHLIFNIPIMPHSLLCNSRNDMSDVFVRNIGGNFILNGKERPFLRKNPTCFNKIFLSDRYVEIYSSHPSDKLRSSSSTIRLGTDYLKKSHKKYIYWQIPYVKKIQVPISVLFQAGGLIHVQEMKNLILYEVLHYFRQDKTIPLNKIHELLNWSLEFKDQHKETSTISTQEEAWVYLGTLSESKLSLDTVLELKELPLSSFDNPSPHLTNDQETKEIEQQQQQVENSQLAASLRKKNYMKKKEIISASLSALSIPLPSLTSPEMMLEKKEEMKRKERERIGRYTFCKEILPHISCDIRKDYATWKHKIIHLARMIAIKLHKEVSIYSNNYGTNFNNQQIYIQNDDVDEICNIRIKTVYEPVVNGVLKGTLLNHFKMADRESSSAIHNGNVLDPKTSMDHTRVSKVIATAFATGIFKSRTHPGFQTNNNTNNGNNNNNNNKKPQFNSTASSLSTTATNTDKGNKDRVGVTQTQNNTNPNSIYSQQQRIQSNVPSVGVGNTNARLIKDSVGSLDFIETPDSKSVGLIKPHALGTRISNEPLRDDFFMDFVLHHVPNVMIKSLDDYYVPVSISSLFVDDQDDCISINAEHLQLSKEENIKIWINGRLIGTAHENEIAKLVAYLREHRYQILGDSYLSISHPFQRLDLDLWCDAGRIVRPLYVASKLAILFGPATLYKSQLPLFTFLNFEMMLQEGFIEFIDKDEEKNDCLIASNPEQIYKLLLLELKIRKNYNVILPKKTKTQYMPFFTHCEIRPDLILGIVSSQIIYAEHNQNPRNVFTSGMLKQAMPTEFLNVSKRFDNNMHRLCYGEEPLLYTDTLKWFHANDICTGNNIMVVNLCYYAKNIEDSLIVNGGSRDRGFARSLQTSTIHTIVRKNQNSQFQSEKLCKPTRKHTLSMKDINYEHLDEDGLPKIGSWVYSGDVCIGKVMYLEETIDDYQFQDTSYILNQKQNGQVKKIMLTTDAQGQTIIKILLDNVRKLLNGDKLSSLHAQKNTVVIIPEMDMPISTTGLIPDAILNPMSLPSRMSVGEILEQLSGHLCIEQGQRLNASIFSHKQSSLSSSSSSEPTFQKCVEFATQHWKLLQDLDAAEGNVVIESILKEQANNNPQEFQQEWMKTINNILMKRGWKNGGIGQFINGMTGECLGRNGNQENGNGQIYYGPVYQMKLLHISNTKLLSRNSGPRNIFTRQPSQSLASKIPSYKVSEMENDCLAAHSAAEIIRERTLLVSDRRISIKCSRCGLSVQTDLRKQIFYCNVCQTDQSIVSTELSHCFNILMEKIMNSGILPRYRFTNLAKS